MKTIGPWLRAGKALALPLLTLLCGTVTAQTTVSITADGFPPKTMEPCPVCRVAPVTVTVTRTGSLTHSLNVGLSTAGTAIPGVDFAPVPDPLVIPAGKPSATFLIAALDDSLAEGPEVVKVSIRPSSTALDYSISGTGSIQAVIADDESGAPAERLDYTAPANGTTFPSGVASIRLQALAVSTVREIDQPVEFYANGVKVGQSSPIGFGRPPIPCLPRDHDFTWPHPADGQYVLTARTPASPGPWLESAPVTISIGSQPAGSVISIVATGRVAEEDSAPTMRPFVFRGLFTVSRTGATTNPQMVYLHVSGTAVSGTDYKSLPFAVSIPAGAASTTVQVEAIPDNIPEPLETVIAEVSNCPPDRLMPPCFDFEIDAAHARDTVFIRDDGITRATLEITAPPKGAHYSPGQAITIDATAIDIDGAITSVDFFAGNQMIGRSQLFFFVQPPPGTPIMHTFTWTGAPGGDQSLTARAVAFGGAAVVSPAVVVTVGGNQSPVASVTSPLSGAQIPSGSPVHITVTGTDPDGYTSVAEFFADGHKLGEVQLNFLVRPPDGGTQTFSFTWMDATPGSHVLSARVRDDAGATGLPAPVTINITVPDTLPVITVVPFDAFAREPATAAGPVNPASLKLRRHGATTASLAVNYSLSGTATNGTDYQSLNGTAIFPAGASSTMVTVIPLADNLAEGRETVVFNLESQFDDGPERYHVGHRRRAIAVIVESSWHIAQPGNDICTPVGDRLFHLCFPAGPAAGFRIEATDDFRRWETVHEGAATDGELHFVDPETPGLPRRFFRMAEDATAGSP